VRTTALLIAVLLGATGAQAEDRVSVDEDGTIRLGEKVLSQRELYDVTGRDDLAAKADANLSRRFKLIIAGVLSGTALLTTGVVVMATSPDMTTPYCQSSLRRYNDECVPQYRLHQALGGTLVVVGAVAGSLLLTFAAWNTPDLLSRRQVEDLVDSHNASHPQAEVRVVPVLDPRLVGVVLRGRF